MKKIFTILTLFISYFSFAQLENANWRFRNYASVNFNPLGVSTCANGGTTDPIGAPASVSNEYGILQFYTNGNKIWDRYNNLMPNGNNLNSFQGNTTNQSTLIVPKPNHPNIYYVFTSNHQGGGSLGPHGFYYSVVDMCLNNGKGDVVPNQKNIPLSTFEGMPIQWDYTTPQTNILEARLTSTPNNDKTKIWVSFFTRFGYLGNYVSDRFAYNYLVTENGINNVADGVSPNATTKYTLAAAEFPNFPDTWTAFGCIKFSPDGSYLCDANSCAVNLYSFNNTTGSLTFLGPKYTYTFGVANAGMGVEFSPNSSLIYFSTYENILYQGFAKGGGTDTPKVMRVRQANVATRGSIIVGEYQAPSSGSDSVHSLQPFPVPPYVGNLQMAIDNKIYVCSNYSGAPDYTYLGIVQDPNTAGINCNFVTNGLALASGITHAGSLPQWIHKTVFTPVNPCPDIWPKAYGTVDGIHGIIKDNKGDVMFGGNDFVTSSTFYNHFGFTPPSSMTYTKTLQFTNSGYTNWYKETDWPLFAFNSGIVEMGGNPSNNIYFVDGATGTTVTPPLTISSNENIVAETNTGEVITCLNNGQFRVFSGGVPGTPITSTCMAGIYRFNPATNNLFVINFNNQCFVVYHVSGTSLTQIFTTTLSFLTTGVGFVQIDTQDKCYFLDNNVLKKYDYTIGSGGQYSTVIIPGFVNQNLNYGFYSGTYSLDKFIILNQTNNYLYALDLVNLTSKKILTSNFNNSHFFEIDGDDVYLTSYNYNNIPVVIGTQSVPPVNQNLVPVFITKLSFQSDFNFRASEPVITKLANPESKIQVSVSPNPGYGEINLTILYEKKKAVGNYLITITNNTGRNVLSTKSVSPTVIVNTSSWQKGIYYIEITNGKGEKSSTSFIKL